MNRFYRRSPKCAWLVDDGRYKLLRQAVDGAQRPLLSVEGDNEMLFGKPVYFCPSLATGQLSLGNVGALVFGDLKPHRRSGLAADDPACYAAEPDGHHPRRVPVYRALPRRRGVIRPQFRKLSAGHDGEY